MGIIQDTIDRGMGYIDRLLFIPSSGRLAVKDYAGIPLWVKVVDPERIINAGEAKGGVTRIAPFQKVYKMFTTRLIQDGCTEIQGDGWSNPEITEYDFDDGTFSMPGRVSVRLKVYLQSKCDGQSMKAILEMVSYDSDRTIEVHWGDQAVWLGDNTGKRVAFEKPFGWQSCRYVGRHHTRIAARLFAELGETDKADKLHAFMDDVGFDIDVYDPFFNASNSYADDFLTTKAVYPDCNLFDDYPWGEGFTPYRSVLESIIVRDAYVCGGSNILGLLDWRNLVPINITSSPFYDCTMAMHLLNKYGTQKAAEAKSWLERAGFDGHGTRTAIYLSRPGLITNITWKKVLTRSSHEGYSLPCFLAAAVKLYQLTDDQDARNWAMEAAGVLMEMQWKHPGVQYHDQLRYRPDHYGGFVGSYKMGSSPQFVNMDHWFTDIRDVYTKRWFPLHKRSYPDYVGFVPTSGECSILSVMGLKRYLAEFGDSYESITETPVIACPNWHF